MCHATVATGSSSHFNWKPIVTVCFCLAINTYALTSLLPYMPSSEAGIQDEYKKSAEAAGAVGSQTESFRVPKLELPDVSIDALWVGFLAWLIASAVTLGHTFTSYGWGWAADRFGRKPIMIFSMFSIATLCIALGLSQSVTSVIAARLFSGLLNGATSTGRALVPELAGKERVVVAMSYLSGAMAIGTTLGPAIGQLCAETAIFFPTGIFSRYPHLLPAAIGALFSLLCVPLVAYIIPETKNLKGGRSTLENTISQSFESIESALEANMDTSDKNNEAGIVGVSINADGIHLPKTTSTTMQATSSSTSAPSPRLSFSALELGETVDEALHDVENNVEKKLAEAVPLLSEAKGVYDSLHDVFDTVQSFGDGGGGDDEQEQEATREGEQPSSSRTEDEKSKTKNNTGSSGVAVGTEARGGSKTRSSTVLGLLAMPNVLILLFMTVLYSVVVTGFEDSFPLWAVSSRDAGGLNWSTADIAKALGAAGCGVVFYQLVVYPRLVTIMGVVKLQHASGVASVFLYAAIPNIVYLPRDDNESSNALFGMSVVFLALVQCANTAMYNGIVLASTNPAPPRLRAKLSGLFLTAQSIGRTMGHAAAVSVYSWSVSSWTSAEGEQKTPAPLVDFHLVFYLLALLMGLVAALGRSTLTLGSMTKVIDDPDSAPSSPTTVITPGTGGGIRFDSRIDANNSELCIGNNDNAYGTGNSSYMLGNRNDSGNEFVTAFGNAANNGIHSISISSTGSSATSIVMPNTAMMRIGRHEGDGDTDGGFVGGGGSGGLSTFSSTVPDAFYRYDEE